MSWGRIAAAVGAVAAIALLAAPAGAEPELEDRAPSSAAWHAGVSLGGDLRSFGQTDDGPPVAYSGRVPLALTVQGDWFFWRYLGLSLRGEYASYQLSDFADRPAQPALTISTYALQLAPELRVPIGRRFSVGLFAGYQLAHLDAFRFDGAQLLVDSAVRHALMTGVRLGYRMTWFGVFASAELPIALKASVAGADASSRAWSAGGGVLVRLVSLGPAQLAASLSYRYGSEHFEQPGTLLAMNETSHSLRLGLELEPEQPEPAAPPPVVIAPPPPIQPPPPPPPKLGFVAGMVLLGQEEGAKPVAGATVTARGSFGERTATTNEAGAFRFDDLPPGAASLHAQKSGLKPADGAAMVVAGENAPTELRLLPEEDQHATLKGQVRDREGRPVSAVLGLSPDGRRVVTDASGRFELRLQPGVQSVVIRAARYLTQRKKVQLKAGETVIFNIELFGARYRR